MPERPEIGEGIREALAARGRELSLADARRLALALLALAEADLLEVVPEDEQPWPHVYNMGPSDYSKRKR